MTDEAQSAGDKPGPARGERELAAIVAVSLVAIIVANAWLCDDAFITFRTSHNFAHGLGMRWNPGERVQSFTSPLWMVLVSIGFLFSSNAWTLGMIFSVACATASVVLFLRLEASKLSIALALAALVFSKTFIDYSTSGLENPLVHALLVAQVLVFLSSHPRKLLLSTLVFALAGLARLDALLFQLPIWADVVRAAFADDRKRTLKTMAVGLTPLIVWHLFALFYFGFLLPNTAYAKLAPDVSRSALVQQGIIYLLSLGAFDSIGVVLIGCGIVLGFMSKDRLARLLLIGTALHVAWVVRVGGDFMAGRMLSPAVMAAAIIVARALPARPIVLAPVAALFGIFAARDQTSTLQPLWKEPVGMLPAGIGDERLFYVDDTSPLNLTRERLASPTIPLTSQWAREGTEASQHGGVYVSDHIGFFGFNAGPRVHVVDPMALTDPLLAHLPALPGWRIGHYRRVVPHGYVETLDSGKNVIADPRIAEYYDHLHTVTSAPLLSGNRLGEVWAMNTGRYDGLLVGLETPAPTHTAPASRSSR